MDIRTLYYVTVEYRNGLMRTLENKPYEVYADAQREADRLVTYVKVVKSAWVDSDRAI
jgi:hypothetical protein